MIKLSKKQEIYIQIGIISLFLILLIPLGNNETVINLLFPKSTIRPNSITGIFFVIFVFAVYSFLRLRKNLKQMDSKWRYLLYFIVIVWIAGDLKATIGEQIMSFRNGLSAIEFQFDNSEIQYRKDSLGVLHGEGHLFFRNFSSDTVVFKGVLHSENFGLLLYNDSITDILVPVVGSFDKEMKIPPKTIRGYPIRFSKELASNALNHSTYNGRINKIRRFTIYSDKDKWVFID
ncbi:MAG: hypothetical protein PHI32_06075 [Dysgonamonadaceae bacterium]|nr:hypothetical protein [Dysgonamonadaceae bacterium]MDD4727668.1 hypothetical protein [Dysgonamonadaceae bacterium]